MLVAVFARPSQQQRGTMIGVASKVQQPVVAILAMSIGAWSAASVSVSCCDLSSSSLSIAALLLFAVESHGFYSILTTVHSIRESLIAALSAVKTTIIRGSNRSECGVYLWVLSRHFGGYLSQLLLQRNGQIAVRTHSLQTDCSLHAYFRMLCIARLALSSYCLGGRVQQLGLSVGAFCLWWASSAAG